MKWLNYFFWLLLLVLLLLVFKNWLFSPTISAGDFWYFFPSMYDLHFIKPYAWYTFASNLGLGGQGYAYLNTSFVNAFLFKIANILNLSWESVSRIFFYMLFLFLAPLNITIFFKNLFPKNIYWIFAPIIFVFNTYILMVVGGGQIITALSYSLMPLILLFMFKIISGENLDKNKNTFLVSLSVIFFFLQCLLDIRIAFATAIAALFYLIFAVLFKQLKKTNLFLFLFTFFLIILINAYWLIPYLFLGADPIKSLGASYSSSDIIKFLSFAKLENSYGLMHPYWPENIFGKVGFMKPEFLFIPILAFSSLFFIHFEKTLKTKITLLFLVTISLVGIFLGKGTNEPLGNIYIWLFNNIPGFQLFRDSFKWYSLVVIGFSILVPYALYNIYLLINKKKYKIYFFNKLNYGLIFISFILIYFIYLIYPALSGNLGGTFTYKKVPQNYKELDSFLSSQNDFFRTLWIPNSQLFGAYTNLHPQISAKEFFQEYNYSNLAKKLDDPNILESLGEASIKYIIIPDDSEKEIYLTDRKYDENKYILLKNQLDKNPNLVKEKSFGKILVYRTISSKDHFWCNCEAEIDYKFINPTKYILSVKKANKNDQIIFSEQFDNGWKLKTDGSNIESVEYKNKLNSFKITKKSNSFEVYYEPQKTLDLGLLISFLVFFFVIGITIVSLVNIIKNGKIE